MIIAMHPGIPQPRMRCRLLDPDMKPVDKLATSTVLNGAG